MLRKIIESKLGPMTNAQFAQVMDLATTDIKINRIDFGRKTGLLDAVEIADRCFVALGRGKVA